MRPALAIFPKSNPSSAPTVTLTPTPTEKEVSRPSVHADEGSLLAIMDSDVLLSMCR